MAYDIEAVRQKYIGFETAKAKGRYPVEHDAIRRHCHMVDDNNPLFIDPEYAKGTSHGAVLAPPSGWLALYFASLGPWPAVFEPLFRSCRRREADRNMSQRWVVRAIK
jgi:acyl dehydratase